MKKFFLLYLLILCGYTSVAQLSDYVINVSEPFDMVLHGEYLYFSETQNGKISRININTGIDWRDVETVVTGIIQPTGLALKGDILYISEFEGDITIPDDGKILKIDLSVTNPVLETVISGLVFPNGLLLDGNNLYYTVFTEQGKVKKINITDTNPTPVEVASGLKWPNGLLLNGNDLYMLESGGEKISKIDISEVNPIVNDVITDIANPCCRPALINNELYFSNIDDEILKIDITESNPIPENVIDTGLISAGGLLYNEGILFICQFSGGRISKYNLGTLSTNTIEKESISFYPNPATDYIKLDNYVGNSNTKIYSVNGQIIKETKIDSNQNIDVKDLSGGVYIVRLENSEYFKFVKK